MILLYNFYKSGAKVQISEQNTKLFGYFRTHITNKNGCKLILQPFLLEGLLQVFEVVTVLRHLEAGAGLVDAFELAVAHDFGSGIVHLQRSEQGYQGGALLWGSGVGLAPSLVQSSLVADADGVGIVVEGVHAYFLLRSCLVELAITGDVVVVADALAVEFLVVALTELVNREVLVAAGSAAVDDDEIDSTHVPLVYLQLCTNRAELMAVRTVMKIWMSCLIVLFFIN